MAGGQQWKLLTLSQHKVPLKPSFHPKLIFGWSWEKRITPVSISLASVSLLGRFDLISCPCGQSGSGESPSTETHTANRCSHPSPQHCAFLSGPLFFIFPASENLLEGNRKSPHWLQKQQKYPLYTKKKFWLESYQ